MALGVLRGTMKEEQGVENENQYRLGVWTYDSFYSLTTVNTPPQVNR